jgi:glycolate oxidase FAD binding subunit
MEKTAPASIEELAETLAQCGRRRRSVTITGAGSKECMGGHASEPDVGISTLGLQRVLLYEPNDLTISVEAGLRWAELQALLARNNQMIPLDPPFFDRATVGGVLAANTCGPRRRLYGSPRDAVIGMRFATLAGTILQSGGMVVKNVAGLDMSKLLIGSFGTLAAIAVANFKLTPSPPQSRTFLLRFSNLNKAIERRDAILKGVLQPAAMDLLTPHAAARLGLEDWVLALQAYGSRAVVDRYSRELSGAGTLDGEEASRFWRNVREFAPDFLADYTDGSIARVSVTLKEVGAVLGGLPVPGIARAGNGVVYGFFPDVEAAAQWLHRDPARSRTGVLEFIPPLSCSAEEQWPAPGNDFAVMQKIKDLFDPHGLLNKGRLYGRI